MMSDPFDTLCPGDITYFKTRRSRQGQWIPVSVWIKEADKDEAGDLLFDEVHGATINGEDTIDLDQITEQAPFWNPIEKKEHDYLMALSDWRAGNNIPETKTDFSNNPLPF